MRFRSTYNIFTDFGEVFDPNWMNYDTVQTPPKREWDYSRELQIEDVDVWEVIWEASGGWGLYASWSPYAEFYLLNVKGVSETFYGAGCQKKIMHRIKELNIPVRLNKIWVDPEDMWLHQDINNDASTKYFPV
jgi:hypothetical protein